MDSEREGMASKTLSPGVGEAQRFESLLAETGLKHPPYLTVARQVPAARPRSGRCLVSAFGCHRLGATQKWGGRRDSNPRRPESQSGALPTELRPPSSDFRGGAPGRNRTCNRRLRRPVLYPVELRAPYKSTSYSANRNLSGRRSGPKQTESEVRADYIGVSWYLKRRMGPHAHAVKDRSP